MLCHQLICTIIPYPHRKRDGGQDGVCPFFVPSRVRELRRPTKCAPLTFRLASHHSAFSRSPSDVVFEPGQSSNRKHPIGRRLKSGRSARSLAETVVEAALPAVGVHRDMKQNVHSTCENALRPLSIGAGCVSAVKNRQTPEVRMRRRPACASTRRGCRRPSRCAAAASPSPGKPPAAPGRRAAATREGR